jgi:hypothetical protein
MLKGKSLHDMSLAEMDVIWDEAKNKEKESPIPTFPEREGERRENYS